MRKKNLVGFILLVLLINLTLPLTKLSRVFGDETTSISETIIDTPELKIAYRSSEQDGNIHWEFSYFYQKESNIKQKLKLALFADGNPLPFQSQDGWQNADDWWIQEEFLATDTGKVAFVTDLAADIKLTVQTDEQSADDVLTIDTLSSEMTGPYQLQRPIVSQTTATTVDGTVESTTETSIVESSSNDEAVINSVESESSTSTHLDSEQTAIETTETTNASEEVTSSQSDVSAAISEPIGNFSEAISLYDLTNYPNIVPEYTTDQDGRYPTHFWTPTNNETVRNHQGKKYGANNWDGNSSWDGQSNNQTNSYIEYGGNGQDADFALRKYAKETNTPGLYDVYLNVRGNQKETIEPVDIVLVIDMSGSMEPSRTNGWNDRAGAVRAGVKEFFKTINQAGIGNYVNVGFVGYSSPGYIDLIQQPIKPVSNNQHVTNINNALNQTFVGGTFTQNGIEKGNEMLLTSTNSNKMMILLTDGVPTFSKRVTQAITENGTVYGTSFHRSDQDQPGNTSGLQRNAFNSWSNYTEGTSSNRDPNIIAPNSDYGRYYDTTNGIRIWNTWAATLGAAKIAKDSGSILHTLGIQLGADQNYLTESQVRARASLIASPGLYRDAETTTEVTDYLLQQAQNVVASFNTIVNASLRDPLGSQFFYEGQPTVKSISTGSNVVTNLPTVQQSNRVVTANNLNLGKNQEVQIHYQVRINTEAEDFIPEKWYPINGPTKLTPDGNNPNNHVDFGVPSAKAPGIKLNLKKVWEEYDKDTSQRPDNIDFKLTRTTVDNPQSWKEGYVRLTKTNWEKNNIDKVAATTGNEETLWLPKFNNKGNDFTYEFSEPKIAGYESVKETDGMTTTFTNSKIFAPLGLKIQKVSDQGEPATPLKGAIFVLSGEGMDLAGTQLIDNEDGTYTLPQNKKLQRNQTYTLTETTPPTGHTATPDSWEVHVSETGEITINGSKDGITVEGNTINYTITNSFQKITVMAEKYITGTTEMLEGAKFTLRKYSDGWNGNGEIIGSENDLLGNDESTKKDLTPGYYTLEETTVPNGYEPDETEFKFQIDDYGRFLDEQENEINATTKPTTDDWYLVESSNDKKFVFAKYNQLRKFEFSILKKDAHTDKKLAGSVFEVRKKDNEQLLAKLTTNDEGTGKFMTALDELFLFEPGVYVIKEVVAPKGFVVLEKTLEVTISNKGEITATYADTLIDEEMIHVSLNDAQNNTINLTIANTPKGVLPATGGQGRKAFMVSAMTIGGMGIVIGGYYLYRNRKGLD